MTDQGSNFLSDLFTNVCRLLRIKKLKTTEYRPQTNAAVERTHQVLVEYLRCYILEDQSDWDKWVAYATFLLNTTPHTSTGFTPHTMLFSRKPNIPGLLETHQKSNIHDNYVKELQARLFKLRDSKVKPSSKEGKKQRVL